MQADGSWLRWDERRRSRSKGSGVLVRGRLRDSTDATTVYCFDLCSFCRALVSTHLGDDRLRWGHVVGRQPRQGWIDKGAEIEMMVVGEGADARGKVSGTATVELEN